MDIKGIKYIGPIFDVSGYGRASRGYAYTLHKLGIPITISPVSFEDGNADLGEAGKVLSTLVNKNIDYNVVIIHLTVEHYSKFYEKDKFNIGYSIWETNKIHSDWVKWINKYTDAIMTGSDWCVETYKNSGVEVPVFAIPHGIDSVEFNNATEYSISNVSTNTYKFYSIFQFIERKNPMALVKSYWCAFQNNEDVALIIKTYRMSFTKEEEQAIRDTIKRMKQAMPMLIYPPIYLISNRLSDAEVLGIHKSCDCLVHLDRGEGFGLCPFEAGAIGNPIIVTGYGGVTEYAKPDNSYLVNSNLTPVFGMGISPFYSGAQMWAEVDCGHAIELMRYVYNNQEEAKSKAQVLKKLIEKDFSWEVVTNQMIDNIKSL